MKVYSVAVRPTPEEVKQNRLYREKRIMADAVVQYIEDDKAKVDRPDVGMKKGDYFFLRREEYGHRRLSNGETNCRNVFMSVLY